MIRLAQRKDIPECIDLGFEFATLSQPIHQFSVSRDRITFFTNELVENPQCVGIVSENEGKIDGIMCGGLVPIYFSEDIALHEMVWYVKKNVKGLLMLDLFESEAKRIGATHIIVGNKPQYYDLTRVYQRRGYSLLENQFVRKV